MDMARFRGHNNAVIVKDGDDKSNHLQEKKPGFFSSKWFCLILLGFFLLPALIYYIQKTGSHESLNSDHHITRLQHRDLNIAKDINKGIGKSKQRKTEEYEEQEIEYSSETGKHEEDPLLGGLLVDLFPTESCRSRHQEHLYRNPSGFKPSAYLVERLRKYEALHKQCGPNTAAYNRTVAKLKSQRTIRDSECNYVVWISYSGLGNRMVTIAATFLYALLTNRVLLIDKTGEMNSLFCEPFPDTSWILPENFPFIRFQQFNESSIQRFGYMLNKSIIVTDQHHARHPLPPYVYLHLTHNYDFHDKLFFCDGEQEVLKQIPWLIMRTNNYFVPSLFLMSSFKEELHRLFPNKNTIFHHLGRYLFHPSNPVWGLITRFYQSYLRHASKRIGMQVRTFDPGYFPYVSRQIVACTMKNKVLPKIVEDDESLTDTDLNGTAQKPIVVLVTSLVSGYYERLRAMYWEHPTVDGQLVSVYQPSHEEMQQTEKQTHNMKALAEIYLLSLSDVLVTSPWSTFGYVAQGLAGIKPFVMYKSENGTVPDPPCGEVMSMEPCFHAPPFYDCKAKKGIDTGLVLPFVKHCEDIPWGLKVVEKDD